MLYFAYGANLNRIAMKRRCPAARPMGAALLRGYRLCFRSYAAIAPDPHASVPGALWELSAACVRALDAFEGDAYTQAQLAVEHDGQTVSAMVYVAREAQPIAPPSLEYYREVAQGYRDWKLDETVLRRARYDVLSVGPGAVSPTPARGPSSNTQRPRRALWDPARQGAGDLDDVVRKGKI
jgi:gamma-glutamylcyclotransferase (GGCT)/AIG2-like uncharacterized protein YtfP